MRKKKSNTFIGHVFLIIFIIFLTAAMQPIEAQTTGDKPENKNGIDWKLVIALLGFGFGLYQYFKRFRERKKMVQAEYEAKKAIVLGEKKKETLSAQDQYRNILEEELYRIGMTGPEFDSKFLTIEESFVSLHLSQSWHCETPFDGPGKPNRDMAAVHEKERHLSPEQVMEQAFQKYRLLLVIGEPGSGKTTLLQYYTVTCLENKHHRLGFRETNILPLYFPLKELKFSNGSPLSLQESLALWSGLGHREIAAVQFNTWLQGDNALVLLDGLDEISDRDKRRQVCLWIKRALSTFKNTRFVLTSRPTGYRKIEGVELECDHLRADIMEFSPAQQARFLNKWYRAVYLEELPVNAPVEQREQKEDQAEKRAQAIIDFLKKEENKSIAELAKVPMLLQIMAILWKNRDYLPGSRNDLYRISLNYLLVFRDERKDLDPLLSADKARMVLGPMARWMLETLKSDYAEKEKMHEYMQAYLQDMDNAPDAPSFCQNLRDRAGLIADYGKDHYIFRHKSFMEFLAASQLLLDCRDDHTLINTLAQSFNDDWWEEPLRFFICNSDGIIFDRFMQALFQSKESRRLNANKENLLQQLVREAPMRKINSMTRALQSKEPDENQKRYILNCLKIIDTKESIGAVHAFLKENKADKTNLALAGDIVAELGARYGLMIEEKPMVTVTAPNSFRNPYEDNVEYILIPGGSYTFSVTGKVEKVPDLYFCKYLVTNKRYRKFISYLEGKQGALEEMMQLKEFAEKLTDFAKGIKGYTDYLGTDPREWRQKLRSRFDEDKKYNSDDQPVVGVTWYAARAYCFWLSCLHAKENVYRLPTETEWEWAAAGREPDGSLREFPWEKDKGGPNPDLANFDGNVGATTPVGRYPAGATPEGLMDMAGNVWEWMENFYDKDKDSYALRGGAWNDSSDKLRCASPHCLSPDDLWLGHGFRVVSFFAPSHPR